MRNRYPGSGLIIRLAVVCLLSVLFLPLSGLAEERAVPPRLIAFNG